MTDLATIDAPSTHTPTSLSTELDTNTGTGAAGGGAPRTLNDTGADDAKDKGPSLRDTIAAEVKDDGKDLDKDALKEEKPAKDKEAAKDAEPAKADADQKAAKESDAKAEKAAADKDAAAPDGDAAAKVTEADKARGHIEPPKNFLPDAKETWRNTPRAVQRDIENTIRTYEEKVATFTEASTRYEPLREYDELVRANGREGLHETLAEVKDLEDMMGKNPIAALNQVLQRAGPRKADGQPVSLFEVAQYIVNQGQEGYQATLAQSQQPQQQQQQENPEVARLQQQLAQMQEQQLAETVITPFKAEHPRYEELQEDIAFFLRSGKVPASLSPSDRLAAAYDMAVRINPASHDTAAPAKDDPDPAGRADEDFSGSKSIKSAPGAVSPDMQPERSGSISDLLRDEMKRAKRS